MIKIFLILAFPLFLFSKIQIVTYFPLETKIIKKIAQKEAFAREITGVYTPIYQKMPKSEISKLSNSKIYFHFGLDVEKEYESVLKDENPNLIIVDLSKGVEKIDNNPYFWTDPFTLRVVAKTIYETFLELDKRNADFYKENYENFLNEIDNTFLKIKQKINGSEITTVYAFDDYWDYFANRFRLNIIKKEKKHLDIAKISSSINFTKDKNIQKILFFKGMDYNVLLSYTNNLNLQVIENDIFDDIWQTNLLEFSQKLFKTNNQHEN